MVQLLRCSTHLSFARSKTDVQMPFNSGPDAANIFVVEMATFQMKGVGRKKIGGKAKKEILVTCFGVVYVCRVYGVPHGNVAERI